MFHMLTFSQRIGGEQHMFGSRVRRDSDVRAASFRSDPPSITRGKAADLLPFQARKLASAPSQENSADGDWDTLLGLIRETGNAVRVTEQRALKIASHAEMVARDAVNELERAKQAAETAGASEQSAVDRAERAEERAFQAEFRASQAEARAAEVETMFAQIREALWAHILNPQSAESQSKAAA